MIKTNSIDTEKKRILKEWEVSKLGEILSLEYGKGLIEAQRKKGKYPVFGSNGIVGYHDEFLINGPGIVVGRKGTIGAINWSDNNFWPIDTTYYVNLLNDEIDLRWLYYRLISMQLSKLNMATGTPGLNRDLAYSKHIFLPSLPEQKKIAEILSTADEAIVKVDEAIEKTERLKKGLMQELLTKGIGHKEVKKTELGRLPKEWEISKVIDLFSVETGTTPSTKNNEYWVDGDINWFTPADMSKLNNQLHIEQSGRKITEKGLKKTNLTLMPAGSILMSTRAPVGYVTILGEPATFNQGCKGLIARDSDKIYYDFYAYYLSNRKGYLETISGGSTFKELSKKSLEDIKLPLPPFPEQKRIAEVLSTVDERLDLLREKKWILERIKKGLMSDLLTGKKRVKVEE